MKAGIAKCFVFAALATGSAAHAADGLVAPDSAWPRWQARLSVFNNPAPTLALDGTLRTPSAALLGDYYFSLPKLLPLSEAGGLRATSGLVTAAGISHPYAATGALPGIDAGDTLPYFGFGYSRSMFARSLSVTADIGVVAQNPAASGRLGRVLFNRSRASLDEAVRELRLAPLVQVGIRYSF